MLVVVPGLASPHGAAITVAQFLDPKPPPVFDLAVFDGRGAVVLREPVTGFTRVSGGRSEPIFVTALTLTGLSPGTRYELRLRETTGGTLTTAQVETLPLRLPTNADGVESDRPFTLWVSSCFHYKSATEGSLHAIDNMLEDARLRPHLKLHLGDQVYLDSPMAMRFLSSVRVLQREFNQTYAKTWTHPLFSRLLGGGANLFMSDDHEFWNNYPGEPFPTPFPLLAQLRSRNFWRKWQELAAERYALIQRGTRTARIDVGPTSGPRLSLFAADTRLDRSVGPARIMSEEAMAELVAWIANLEYPGILAVSQPLLSFPGGADNTNLPFFRQFREPLLRALRKCPVDLVVLAGDVHFGRVAVTTLNRSRGTRLIEVVASPLALVSDVAAAVGRAHPQRFPPFGPEAERTTIEYVKLADTYFPPRIWTSPRERSEEHGMLLSFHADKRGGIALRVRPHYVRAETSAQPWTWETTLQGRAAEARAGVDSRPMSAASSPSAING